MNLWRAGREPGVAFIFDNYYRSGIRYKEIRAANPDIGREEFLSQHGTRDLRLLLDNRLTLHAQVLRQDVRHFEARHLQGWGDDVVRPQMGELNDVLSQIGFDRFQSVVAEPLIEIDFLGSHRFRFDDEPRLFLFRQRQDEV